MFLLTAAVLILLLDLVIHLSGEDLQQQEQTAFQAFYQ